MLFSKMVLGKIEYLISGTSQTASSKVSNLPYGFVGLSTPEDDTDHQLGYADSGDRNNLRHCSSLQDLSTYRCSDLEGGDNGVRLNKSSQRENGGSSFSKVKGLHIGNSILCSKFLQRLIIILCVVLFLLLIYFTAIYILSYWFHGTSRFYIVLDCGSTGTRVYVYEASVNQKVDENFPIHLKSVTDGHSRRPNGRAYDRMETEPGFHTFVRNMSGLNAALKPLLHWAEKQIPIQSHKSASLFLCATAGLRRLPNSDSTKLLDRAYSIMKKSPFRCQREWVRIVSGTEEAYYGWVSLNYMTGILGSNPKKSTFGALDLGGSSLQVTFESDNGKNSDSNLNLRIGAVSHRLSAYSLSGYGLNDAFDKSVYHLYRRNGYPDHRDEAEAFEIKHPCLQQGYQAQYHCSLCMSKPAISMSPVGKEKKSKSRAHVGAHVQLIGSPNWNECRTLARAVVNLSEWSNQIPGMDCKLKPCAISYNLPQPHGPFYGMSGFYVVYRFFNLTSEDTLDHVLEKGQQFCDKTWDVAKSSVPPQPYIEQYCFRAPYAVLLLREGLNISDSQIHIGSGSVTWTTGVALLEAGKSFSTALRIRKYEIFGVKIHFIAIIAILFTSMLFLLCVLSFLTNRMPRFFARSYIPLVRHNNALTASVLQSPFRFKRWSPMSSGDGRTKMPLSPIAGSGTALGAFGAQPIESGFYSSAGSAAHSYSLSNLGQMSESNSVSSFMIPRGQFRLQSRRSQSREDLSSSLADSHILNSQRPEAF